MSTMLLEPPTRSEPSLASTRPSVGVSCRGVTKEFANGDARLRVLHDIDLDVGTSELTLLVGPSGCGKTTLISIIAGLLDPTAGDVELFGVRQSALKMRVKRASDALRKRLAPIVRAGGGGDE